MTHPNTHIPPRNPSFLGISWGILCTAAAVIFVIGVHAAVTTHPHPHPTVIAPTTSATTTVSPGPVASTRPGPPPTTSP